MDDVNAPLYSQFTPPDDATQLERELTIGVEVLTSTTSASVVYTRSIWKMLDYSPIRHNEPPHAHSADVASGTVARRLRIDVYDNANDDNDNEWQRGPLWPHGTGPISACTARACVQCRVRPAHTFHTSTATTRWAVHAVSSVSRASTRTSTARVSATRAPLYTTAPTSATAPLGAPVSTPPPPPSLGGQQCGTAIS